MTAMTFRGAPITGEHGEPDMESLSTPTAVADRVAGGLPASRLRRVTQYIDENLHDQLRLVELGALVHMSPYHFGRLFKRSTGVSPHRFLVQRRIDRARALLVADTTPIVEIARAVGFCSASHFTTTFRRVTGTTPSVYRRTGGQIAPNDRTPSKNWNPSPPGARAPRSRSRKLGLRDTG